MASNSRTIPNTTSCFTIKTFLCYLILLAVLLATIQCQQCPTRCHSCTGGTARCHRRRLTAPPRAYPPSIRTIDLQNNNIRVIGSRTFRPGQTAEILKLANNRLSGLRNDAFRSFPRLMTLDLRGNRISRIYPRAFANLSRVHTLLLSRNRIRRIGGIFRGTVNLQQLNLAGNKLNVINENDLAPLTRIRHLDLSSNNISRINPRAFDQLPNLRYLFLKYNPIAQALTNINLAMTALQLLDMSNCLLRKVPSRLPTTVSDLRLGNNKIMQINYTDFENVTDLQMLTLNNNELHFLADGTFAHLTKLKQVWLRHNNLVYVPRDIPPNVEQLHMDSNRIQEIEPGLFSNESRLEEFSAESNNLRRIDPATFRELSYLKTIKLQANQLQVLEQKTFADLESLETIQLSNNPLQRIEREAFKNLPNVTQLHISYLLPETMELQDNFLLEIPNLKVLKVMASVGMGQALVDMIENTGDFAPMPSVTTVDLSYNNIQTLPQRLSSVFPNARKMILDGNTFQCTDSLRWLQEWMTSSPDITFHNYEELTCDTPESLRGREIRSLTRREFREGSARSRNRDRLPTLRRSRRRHGDSINQEVEGSSTKQTKSSDMIDTSSSPTKEMPTPLALRHQREERRRKKLRRGRTGRTRKGRRGNKKRRRRGRKNRNKKNRKRGKNKAKRKSEI